MYPNPADDYIRVILPQRQKGIINIKLYNPYGYKISDYDEDTSEGYPLILGIAGYAAGVYTLIITNTATQFTDFGRFIILRK